MDAPALHAREQAVAGAVSQAMLAVTSLRHLTPRQRTGPTRRPGFVEKIPRAGETGLGSAEDQGSLSLLSHELARQYRTRPDSLDIEWTLTCGYGFWRTGRTDSIDLRIRRLGSAPLADLAWLHDLGRDCQVC